MLYSFSAGRHTQFEITKIIFTVKEDLVSHWLCVGGRQTKKLQSFLTGRTMLLETANDRIIFLDVQSRAKNQTHTIP